jgi:hypothetical protein
VTLTLDQIRVTSEVTSAAMLEGEGAEGGGVHAR